jgi:predicted nucleic acid-binding protein
MSGSFFDTNVILYLVSTDPRKADRAEALLREGGTISVQVLNETAAVARRKMKLEWLAVHTLLDSVRGLVSTVDLTVGTHERGLGLAKRYRFSLFDAMIVAAAVGAGCSTLWSEDMQHDLVIDDVLRIQNPFG